MATDDRAVEQLGASTKQILARRRAAPACGIGNQAQPGPRERLEVATFRRLDETVEIVEADDPGPEPNVGFVEIEPDVAKVEERDSRRVPRGSTPNASASAW